MYIWIIIIVSAIWVLIDAKNIGVKKGIIPGFGDMGPFSWFLVTLLLWIVGFPFYLYYRGKFKIAIANANKSLEVPTSGSVKNVSQGNMGIDDLQKLAELKEKGVLSESEYEAKKKQILGL